MENSRRQFLLSGLAVATAASLVGVNASESLGLDFISPLPPPGDDILTPFVPQLPEETRRQMAEQAKQQGVRLLHPETARRQLRNASAMLGHHPAFPSEPPVEVPAAALPHLPFAPVTPTPPPTPTPGGENDDGRAASAVYKAHLPLITTPSPQPPPSSAETQQIITNATNWVRNLVRNAPRTNGGHDSNHRAISMYHAWPLTVKVPSGYTISGAQSNCDYVRHCGSEFRWYLSSAPYVLVFPSFTFARIDLRDRTTFNALVQIGPWSDDQPWPALYVSRYSSGDQVIHKVYYYGKHPNDTRAYPIKLYWENQEIIADHRTKPAEWIFNQSTYKGQGARGHKYFFRTEDIPAAKLFHNDADSQKLRNFIAYGSWPDVDYDIHSPLFHWGLNLHDEYMFHTPDFSPTYFDCNRSNNGCPQDWPYDASRSATQGWGFSHRSKVCVWEGGYTWVLRQDPLGLLAQAMHILLKYNDPWRSYASPWPWGVPGGPPSTVTPISMVDWVWNRFWRTGVGCTMYNVPIIGSDQRVSSLRTNQMLVATTLLGYRYLLSQTWRDRADAVAGVLRQVQIGGYGQPVNGVHSIDGEIVRPDYFGSQAFVWDALDPHVREGGAPKLGVVGFGWLRQTINAFFNLPNDDEDWILSTVETTATYAQAWRAYLYHKFNILAGNVATIPGH
jgi:hypothetical protein